MRVIVLGAGLLGVTSAYYLQQLGHEVTVIDRHAMPAANARGRNPARAASAAVAAAQEFERAAARQPQSASVLQPIRRSVQCFLASLFQRGPALPDPGAELEKLCAYSRVAARSLHETTTVPPAARGESLLRIYTDRHAFDAVTARAPRLQAAGCDRRVLTAMEAAGIEPALASSIGHIAGAMLSLDGPSGDALAFAAEMVFLCRAAGVRFLTEHTVVALHEGEGRVDHVEVINGHGERRCMRAQAYVMALGSASLKHVNELGQELPLSFARQYAIDVPVRPAAMAPTIALYDNDSNMRLRPTLGDGKPASLRLTCSVPVQPCRRHDGDPARFDTMLRRAELLLPGVVDTPRAQFHTRLQTITSNGLPLIGRTRLPNLFLNTAPGTLGWVNACGAGKSIARIVSGLRPELAFAFTGL